MDRWSSGDAYEPFIGRWSRLVAREFVAWLDLPAGLRWVDVGCGTGALTETIRDAAAPGSLLGVDPSAQFVAHATTRVGGARFAIGSATALPVADGGADVVVSGLVLNFVPDVAAAVAEARRVAPRVAAYVWDYAEGMEPLRHFWDVAIALDPAVRDLDEATRFPLCRPEALRAAVGGEVTAITVPTVFADFDDYWTPFLGGVGPGPTYVAGLDPARRDALRDALRDRLGDGRIDLTARAWAVRAG